MKFIALFFIFVILVTGCNKDNDASVQFPDTCDNAPAYEANAKRVTITSGVWGTVSSTEGNCMPTIFPARNDCRTCAVQRKVRVYEYTTLQQAITSDPSKVFSDDFTTKLVAETESDAYGFYQVSLPPGKYTIVVVENGKLYANSWDGNNGINPFSCTGGRVNVNLSMTYKAVF